MTLAEAVKGELLRIEEARPSIVKSKLALGDTISANLYMGSFAYRIDDEASYAGMGTFSDDTSFYIALATRFRGLSMANLAEIFPPDEKNEEGHIIVPFSRAVNSGIGGCLEKSALVQLKKQKETECFLVYGLLSHDRVPAPMAHAWNIIVIDGKPYLLDAQNPMIVTGNAQKREVPYIVPLTGVEGNKMVIMESWRAGRRYVLPAENPSSGYSILDKLFK